MKIEKLELPALTGLPKQRCTKEELYYNLLYDISRRSSCPQGKRHAAIALKDSRIIATGYNGPAAGIPHCDPCTLQTDTIGKDWRTCPAVHAEENVIANAAKYGTAIISTILVMTKKPCERCMRIIINAGISEVYYLED